MARDTKAILCPYCGLMQPQASSDDSGTGQRCSACGGLFDPLSRKATQIAMGPWYIRDKANPFRPGCCFEVLKRQIDAGKLKPTTVLRGPTTRQFWAIARNVPGISHLLGYCHRCGAKVSKTDVACPECSEPFMEPDERNELGLMFATKRAAEAAYKQLEKEVDGAGSSKQATLREAKAATAAKQPATAKPAGEAGSATEGWQPGLDLLDEVIGPGPAASSPARSASDAESASSNLADTAASPTATASGGARPSPAIKFGSAIDFAPADADSEEESPRTTATASGGAGPSGGASPVYGGQNRNMQIVVWLLLAVNLLLLPILVGGLLYFMGVFDNGEDVGQPSPQTSVFETSFDAPPPPVPAAPPAARTTAAPDTVAPIAPAQPTAVTPAPVDAFSQATVAKVQTALDEAQRLEDAGELQRAIAILKDVQQKARPNERPADLDARIHRVQEKIDRAESATWFGVPIQADQ